MLKLKKTAKETAAELKRLGYHVEWKIATRTYVAADRFGQTVTVYKDTHTAEADSIQKENTLVATAQSYFEYEGPQAAQEPDTAMEAPDPKRDPHRTTEAQRKAVAAWVKSRDSIVLRVPKETGAEIRASAKAAGMTVTAYILACVNRDREVD